MEWLQTYELGKALLKKGNRIEEAYYQNYQSSRNKEHQEKIPYTINISIDTDKESVKVDKHAFDRDYSIQKENMFNAGGSSYTSFYTSNSYAKFKKGFLEFFGLAVDKSGKQKNQDIFSEIVKLKKERKIDLSQSSFLEYRKKVLDNKLLCDKVSALINNIEFVIENNKTKKLENLPRLSELFSDTEITQFKEFVKINNETEEVACVRLTIDSVAINRDEGYKQFCLERLYKLGIDFSNKIESTGYFDQSKVSFAASFPRDGSVNILKCSTGSPTALSNLTGISFLLSEDSYNALKLGAKKIDKELKIELAGIPHYVVPEFVGEIDIRRFRSDLKNELAFSIKEYENTRKRLSLSVNHQVNSIILLGYIKGEGYIDFVNSIRISSAQYFDQLMNTFEEAKDFSSTLQKFSFQQIYYLFPVPSDKSKKTDSLFFYKSIFENTPYELSSLMDTYARLIQLYKSGRPYEKAGKKIYGGTINIAYSETPEPDIKISVATKKIQVLLNLLTLLSHTNQKNLMDYSNLPPKTQKVFQQCQYKEDKAALFYLGKLLRLTADAQAKKQKNKRRPILDKINYGGMKLPDLKWLCCEILEKMKQYEVLRYAHDDMTEFKRYFDIAEANGWKLSEIENVFYIFSGYAMYWEVREETIPKPLAALVSKNDENEVEVTYDENSDEEDTNE